MIGKFIRSTKHLEHSASAFGKINILFAKKSNFFSGLIIKKKNFYYAFQNCFGNVSKESALSDLQIPVDADFMNEYFRCYKSESLRELFLIVDYIIVLPTDFETLFSSFIKNNKKMLNDILYKCGNDNANAPLIKLFFCICENPNYFVWGLKNYMGFYLNPLITYRFCSWAKKYNQLIGKLKRGALTSYTNLTKINELQHECSLLRRTKRANDIVNMFNTTQKKLLKNNISNNDKLVTLLNKFAVLSFTKKMNFIKKVSTIEDINEFVHLLSLAVSEHFEWNKVSFHEYLSNVENLKYKIIYENENCVVASVADFETVKKLARTTNWCISKNKTYWNNYMSSKDAKQYVLFDFSKKEDDELSIVGFTTKSNCGVSNAHSFTNANLMCENQIPRYESLMVSSSVNNIYEVLSDANIPLSLFINVQSYFTEWNGISVLKIFDEKIGINNYSILSNKNNQMVISVKNVNLEGILTGNYKLLHSPYKKFEHLLFFDFNKPITNSNKILYTILFEDNGYQIPEAVFNEFAVKSKKSFQDILDEFDLPFDIICRPDSLLYITEQTLNNGSFKNICNLLKNDEILQQLNARYYNFYKEKLKDEVINSVLNYYSLDLWNYCIQAENFDLTTIIDASSVTDLLMTLYDKINTYTQNRKFDIIVTSDLIEKYYKNTLPNGNNGFLQSIIGTYLIFTSILFSIKKRKHVFFVEILKQIQNQIIQKNVNKCLTKMLCEEILTNVNFDEDKPSNRTFFDFVQRSAKINLKDIKTLNITNKSLHKAIFQEKASLKVNEFTLDEIYTKINTTIAETSLRF